MKRCVIVGGARISNYAAICKYLNENDFNVFCDSGLDHLNGLGIKPNLIIGDFDSHAKPETDVETITLPREKDDTDTFFAAKEGIKRGFDEFLLIGVTGGRLDHTLGNISVLLYLEALGKKAVIVDDYSELEIISHSAYIDDSYSYFSLLAVSGTAKGIMIKNAKFPLENAEILPEYQYGVSNEVVKGKVAEVTVSEGKLLLVKVIKE